MSKGTLDRLAVRYFQTAIDELQVETTDAGSNVIRALSVFRSGTFKDSWGDPHTWEHEHLEQMVFNFSLLRSRGVLPNIPVRDGHGSLFGGGGDVVGYVADLYTVTGAAYEDGYTRLLADLEITEPDAFGKIQRGTWRSRSAEIGFYETNDEVMYWPVFMGVAWVDIPAVEGLFSNHNTSGDKFTAIRDIDQEGAVAGTKKQVSKHQQSGGGSGGGGGSEEGGTSGATGTGGGGSTEGSTEGAGTEGGTEGGSEEEGTEGGTEGGGTEGGGTGTPPPAQQQHGGSNGGVHTFRVNGQPVQDFGQVQSHIDNLEAVVSEQRDQSRKDFVSGLAERGMILASQIDGMQAHALTLNTDQWEAFKKMYPESEGGSSLFEKHGTNGSESHQSGGEGGPSEVDTLRERVKMHRQSGMPDKKVQQTESYKRLMELTENKG